MKWVKMGSDSLTLLADQMTRWNNKSSLWQTECFLVNAGANLTLKCFQTALPQRQVDAQKKTGWKWHHLFFWSSQFRKLDDQHDIISWDDFFRNFVFDYSLSCPLFCIIPLDFIIKWLHSRQLESSVFDVSMLGLLLFCPILIRNVVPTCCVSQGTPMKIVPHVLLWITDLLTAFVPWF